MSALDMLAVTWDEGRHAPLLRKHPYAISLKYDGVRASWDGCSLTTRNGNLVHPPSTWSRRLPRRPLEGELYIARGRFGEVAGLIHRRKPPARLWKHVRFMVFDDPRSPTPFARTYATLRASLPTCAAASRGPACLVAQRPVTGVKQVLAALRRELSRGGEGVVLRRLDLPYARGRTSALIKVKGQQDAEALVVGHVGGTGRLSGRLGALECVWVHDPDVRFRVGSGFTEAQRLRGFPRGTKITVQFMSVSPTTGKPRHPIFKGVRRDV